MRQKEGWRLNLEEFELLSRKVNVIHPNKAASLAHEKKKAEVALELWAKGHYFLCDGKLTRNRGYCDVVDLTDGIIYEVMHTEREESIEAKRIRYPFAIEVVKV